MGGRREDQLAVRVEKLVEQVEELFLRAFLPRQELNVVEQERGGAAIACPPPIHAIPVDRRDQLVDEPLSRQTRDNRALLPGQLETDGVQQVRFAESALPDNHERVVFLSRLRDHVARGAEHDFVRGPRDVGIKRKGSRGSRRRRRAVADLGGRRFGLVHAIRIVKDFLAGRLRIECSDFRLERFEPINVLHICSDCFIDGCGRFLIEQLLQAAGAIPFPFPPQHGFGDASAPRFDRLTDGHRDVGKEL